jgi:hypothetical protein
VLCCVLSYSALFCMVRCSVVCVLWLLFYVFTYKERSHATEFGNCHCNLSSGTISVTLWMFVGDQFKWTQSKVLGWFPVILFSTARASKVGRHQQIFQVDECDDWHHTQGFIKFNFSWSNSYILSGSGAPQRPVQVDLWAKFLSQLELGLPETVIGFKWQCKGIEIFCN